METNRAVDVRIMGKKVRIVRADSPDDISSGGSTAEVTRDGLTGDDVAKVLEEVDENELASRRAAPQTESNPRELKNVGEKGGVHRQAVLIPAITLEATVTRLPVATLEWSEDAGDEDVHDVPAASRAEL